MPLPASSTSSPSPFAGVINIITKSAAELGGGELGLRGGSFDTRNGWAQYGGKLGPLAVAGYLRAGQSDGFRRTVQADAQSGLDALFGTRASLAPGSVNTGWDAVDGSLDLGHGKVHLRTTYKLREKLGTGAGISEALDPVGKGRSERLAVELSAADIDLASNWKLSLSGSHARYVQEHDVPLQLFPAGAFGGSFTTGMRGAPNTWERQTRLSAVASYLGLDGHTVRLGVGHDRLNMYRTQELKNFTFITVGPLAGLPAPLPGGQIVEVPVAESFLEPHARRVSYAYVQDEWAFARDWALTAGVRYDRYSDFGGTTNPRLALVWDASLDLTGKLMFGRAFRAPAFADLYSFNPVTRGNPSLKPETINTLEAAVAWQIRPDAQINLSVFRYTMKDIIRTTADAAGGPSSFNNTGSRRGRGAELEGVWDASRSLRLAAHYAYQRSVDEQTGGDAGYAPHHHAYARADWRMVNGWLASAQANHVAGRARPVGDARPPVPDYTTVDLTLRSGRALGDWELALSARNLFDADVREPSLAPGASIPGDLPMAPRSVYLQATYRF
jgi:outer membrane receptor protein involved in Fe transport